MTNSSTPKTPFPHNDETASLAKSCAAALTSGDTFLAGAYTSLQMLSSCIVSTAGYAIVLLATPVPSAVLTTITANSILNCAHFSAYRPLPFSASNAAGISSALVTGKFPLPS